MKKLTIKWNKIGPIECSGIATLDEWKKDQSFVDKPWRSTDVEVAISQNLTSMKNFSRAIFTDQISERLKEMMNHFFRGVKCSNHIWEWFDFPKKTGK